MPNAMIVTLLFRVGPEYFQLAGCREEKVKGRIRHPQWLAHIDYLLSSVHPERLFLCRHKFYYFRVWYRDALAHYVRQMLLDRRTLSRPYLKPN